MRAQSAFGPPARGDVLDLLIADMKMAMALTGNTRIETIGRNTIAHATPGDPPTIPAGMQEERGIT